MVSSTESKSPAVLVVDDEPDLRTLYELTLLRAGYQVDTASNVQEAQKLLAEKQYDVLITDMRLPDGLGLNILKHLRAENRSERSVVITAYGSAENAVESLKAGAFDYLTKPVDLKQFRQVISSALQDAQSSSEAGSAYPVQSKKRIASNANHNPLKRLTGSSAAIEQVRERIAKVACSMAPVLIHGESGTGKELVANALHQLSHRQTGPWVAVNCGAIPENLLEAEFFGAKKGAYTGAAQDRIGFFQAAAGGTLFLDEIGDLPLSMQAKLLRAIQERRVRPLGSTQEELVDVRLVSATHKDLSEEVRNERFRQDLFYRINVIDIDIPPLRERREDLPELCESLLQHIHVAEGPPPKLSERALNLLNQLALFGNVRELENLLHRAYALHDGPELELEDYLGSGSAPVPLSGDFESTQSSPSVFADDAASSLPIPEDLQKHLDLQEREILLRALRETGFNRTKAAAMLGLNLRQIRYRMERLKIDPLSREEDDADS